MKERYFEIMSLANANNALKKQRKNMYSDDQLKFLFQMAQRYIWWKKPELSITQPNRVLAQVMELGTMDDARTLINLFSKDEIQDVLRNAEIGWFSPKSWNHWHRYCNLETPSLPERIFA